MNEREITLKRYGKFIRATDAPKTKQNNVKKKGGKRETNTNTPKSRSNFGSSAHKALAIALNNDWHWYGQLQLSQEDITTFDEMYRVVGRLTNRLQRTNERSEEKDFNYLIIPDFTEQNEVKKWFLHIWLMNVPNPDKAFEQEPVSEKKIIYHWKKYEKLNGRSELYKIYNSGYTTNDNWREQNAFQIFDIMKRTAPVTPKNKRLYYSSDNVMIDDIIAKGRPSEIYTISASPDGNPFVMSAWFTGLNLQKNLEEAKKYLFSSDLEREERKLAELLEDDLTPPAQQEDTFFSYDSYSYEGEYLPPAADDYYFCDIAEHYEVVENFDYSVIDQIYNEQERWLNEYD